MKPETLLNLATIAMSIPGFALLFVDGYWVAGILVLIVVAILLYIKWRFSRPHFTIKSLEKTLQILDDDAHRARLIRRQEAVANHKGITEFWCCNIGADGGIENVLIDGAAPSSERTNCNDLEVCKKFDDPLSASEEFTTILSYDLIDCFERDRESLIHVVEGETKKLVLKVEFPEAKQFSNESACVRFGGAERVEVKGLKKINNSLEIEIKRPKPGGWYSIQWSW